MLVDPAILNHTLLDRGEERRLIAAHQAGDSAATDKLLRHNERLIFKIALRVWTSTGRRLPFDDVHQEARVGFATTALDKFDLTSGNKLSTYASYWIRQAAGIAVATQSDGVPLGVHHAEVMRQVRKAETCLSVTLRRQPTNEEIADHILGEHITPDVVTNHRRLEARFNTLTSLDAPLYEADTTTLADSLPAQEPEVSQVVADQEIEQLVREVFETLPVRQARILAMRFGFPYYGGRRRDHLLREVGDRFGQTKERIRQLEAEAMNQLAADEPERRARLRGALQTYFEED